MGNQVYANNQEVACKAANGKAIAATPDPCWTPPLTPATPTGVLIPYPNTAMASDTTDGSTNTQISGQEIMLKSKSSFKKSTGDEAGSAPLKGAVTMNNTGSAHFNSGSMDVMIEGDNTVRNLDLTTHNHQQFPGNSPTWPYVDEASMGAEGACKAEQEREAEACKEYTPHGSDDLCEAMKPLPYDPLPRYAKSGKPSGSGSSDQASKLAKHHAGDKCMNARRCFLQPYSPSGCCDPQTGHHLIEASSLFDWGRGGTKKGRTSIPLQGVNTGPVQYEEGAAPCVCAEGINQNTGSHGWMHTFQSVEALKIPATGTLTPARGPQLPNERVQTYGQAKANANKAMKKVFPASFCSEECINKQLDNYHNQCGVNDSTQTRAVVEGHVSPEEVAEAEQGIQACTDAASEYMGNMSSLVEDLGIPIF
ncbi:MAG: PAAR-like domain-containing protein [Steroidobacteraceae bacterium]